MPIVLTFLVLVLLYFFITLSIKNSTSQQNTPSLKGNDSEFKCVFCLHCEKLEQDGVLCKYGKTTIFKTPVHINNCIDFEINS